MEFRCNCHNSGTNSFTGKCSNCGMTKPSNGTIITNSSTVEINPYSIEQQVKERIQYLRLQVLKLEKYQPTFEGLMDESEEYGEYVKIEDILNLFSAQNKIKTEEKLGYSN